MTIKKKQIDRPQTSTTAAAILGRAVQKTRSLADPKKVKPEWQKYFQAEGKYRLLPTERGKTRRSVEGDLFLRVPIVQKMAERAILGEVRRMFDAEAETLKEMATLA